MHPYHIIGWYCLMECYEGLNNFLKVSEIKTNLHTLIKNDSRAQEMYNKYAHLIPKYKFKCN